MCLHLWFESVSNPYATEQTAALAVLIFVAALWTVVRPSAVPLFRAVIAGSAALVVACVGASASGLVLHVAPLCTLAVYATVLAAGGLVAELVTHWRRERIPTRC